MLPTMIWVSQVCGNFFGESWNVLCVVEDLNPLRVLVSFDAFESFQHFVAADLEPTFFEVQLREQRSPDRVGVQDRSDIRLRGEYGVQQCFGRRLWLSCERGFAFRIDSHKVRRLELSLVLATRRHEQL